MFDIPRRSSWASKFIITSKHKGNEIAFINDGMDASNCFYFFARVNGIYCVFCIAIRDIKKDEQVCDFESFV